MAPAYLGIDIAKAKFNVCLLQANGKLKHKVFLNSSVGFQQLSTWLQRHQQPQVHACLEATGTYGEALALYLYEQGQCVSLINPAAIKAFAASCLSRTKTDRVDAELIARFCQAQQPPAWRPPAAEVRELQALVRRLEALIEMRVAEENRLAAGPAMPAVQTSLTQMLNFFLNQTATTEKLIRQHLDQHPDLRQQRDLLTSIPGIGETTAALLLAEVPHLKQYRSARQLAACAGLVPRERQSGSSLKGRVRLSKIGNARLRKGLYFPAVTALRCSSFFQQWASGLRERGKCKMSVIGAVMRKLLHVAFGVLKSGCPFAPELDQRVSLS